MPRSKGRTGRPYLRCAAQVRAWVRDHGAPCWLCGNPIDLDLPARHPMSFSVDHVVPLNDGGSPRDIENMKPAHLGHNAARGNKLRAARAGRTPTPPPATSRAW